MTAEAPLHGLSWLRLLQLASPTLPIGAFAYSQGLEPAVAAGLVTDETSAGAWWTVSFDGLAIASLVVGVNLVADGIQSAFDA